MSGSKLPFDLLGAPLEGGIALIEASAGTGKTYTIAGLVLRLIIEKGLGIDEILVSTYTELATAELRNRIRALLREALSAFESGRSSDALIKPMVERHSAQKEEIQRRLRLALGGFDEAPVYTIHGFCRRMLKDRAFESGALFDAELITDQTPVLREVADDFWRIHFYDAEPVVALFASRGKLTADNFFARLRDLTNNPTMRVIPETDSAALDALKTRLAKTWKALRDGWATEAATVRAVFKNNTWANKKFTQGKPDRMEAHLADLDECLSEAFVPVEIECLEIFAASKIERATAKGWQVPRNAVFDLCEELIRFGSELAAGFEATFAGWARAELRRRKIDRNVLSFDDMLTRLDEALAAAGGDDLARSVRARFKSALIDEFQDTDPIQYRIFSRIYAGSGACVFFIGDPKQAIYGFRGADIFTYIKAARVAKPQYTLGENWRSEARLVAAVNHLFTQKPKPFVLEAIGFSQVKAAGEADKEPLLENGVAGSPMRLWMVTPDQPLNARDARQALSGAVAAEIARLLNGDLRQGARRIEPRDIAVLVCSNREGGLVQDALAGLGVPAIVYSSDNVFLSRDAEELERILAAVAEPGQEKLVRAALATEALGLSGSELDELARDERTWEARVARFHSSHEMWLHKGFIQMLRALMTAEGVRRRLLALPDGERRLTNLLHLAELLHRLSVEERLGMSGLLKRLAAERRESGRSGNEDFELRLERDEDAVRILTIHKSKGLEFGIVFCPFCWADPFEKKREARFHDPENGDRLTLDLGSVEIESHKARAAVEDLAERLRLLYVALTRAEHRCYLVWGNFKKSTRSALAYLFDSSGEVAGALAARRKNLGGPGIRCEAENVVSAELSIRIGEPPGGPAPVFKSREGHSSELHPRVFSGVIDRTGRLLSFTSLVTGREAEAETPGEDQVVAGDDVEIEPEAPPTGIFAFPRGTAPGTCLHLVFEGLDFRDLTGLPDLVHRKLGAFGIRGFDEVVCDTVRRAMAVPLDPAASGLTLARVPRTARLQELEFSFPVRDLTPRRLADFFARHGAELGEAIPASIGRLQFRPGNGFIKGFIDLVFEDDGLFYIVDWKSNWLGATAEAYHREALDKAMSRNFYHLQASLYAVALHRFLRFRKADYDFERDFGGSIYVFLRGIDPARPELGIWRGSPSRDFVEGLSALLGGEE